MEKFNGYQYNGPNTSTAMNCTAHGANFLDSFSLYNNNESQLSRISSPFAERTIQIAEPELWLYFAQQPIKQASDSLMQHIIANKIQADVEVLVGNMTFSCHMALLRTHSQYFEEMQNVTFVVIPEDEVTTFAFNMVYTWMMQDYPLVQRCGVVETYRAAVYLRIEALVAQCMSLFNNEFLFDEDTAFLLFWEAKYYFDLEHIQQMMLSRINKFFLCLVGSREFLHLSARDIVMLCSLDSIGVNSEIEVFLAIVHWLAYDWNERSLSLVEVVKCVRFSLIPKNILYQLITEPDCEEVAHVSQHPFVVEIIDDIFDNIKTQFDYCESQDECFFDYGNFQNYSPIQRNWVIDKVCAYHHHLECYQEQNVTYDMFLRYLCVMNWRLLKMSRDVIFKMQCCVHC